MASKIILKKSVTAAKAPVIGDLEYGELALNYTDGKLYYKTASNTIDSFSAGVGGGGSVHTSDTPPTTPSDGDLWWDSVTGQLYVYYQDTDTSQWVGASVGEIGPRGYAATLTAGTITTVNPNVSPSVSNTGNTLDAVFAFSLPRAATISVGTTTTGAAGSSASLTNTGSNGDALLNFTIPRGDTGLAATVSVGSTTTGAAGSNASVSNSGTTSAAVLNFTIPQGVDGLGVPAGGTTGQILTKVSSTDNDTTWSTPSGISTGKAIAMAIIFG